MVSAIIIPILLVGIAFFVVALAVNTTKEIWNEILKDEFYSTKLGIWYWNKKQGATIISEKEYNKLVKKGTQVINIKID